MLFRFILIFFALLLAIPVRFVCMNASISATESAKAIKFSQNAAAYHCLLFSLCITHFVAVSPNETHSIWSVYGLLAARTQSHCGVCRRRPNVNCGANSILMHLARKRNQRLSKFITPPPLLPPSLLLSSAPCRPPKNALRVLSGMEHGRWRRAKCRPRCGPKSWLHIEGGKGEWDGERGKGQGEPQAVQRA